MENTVWYYFFVLWWGVFLAVIVAGVGSLGLSQRVTRQRSPTDCGASLCVILNPRE